MQALGAHCAGGTLTAQSPQLKNCYSSAWRAPPLFLTVEAGRSEPDRPSMPGLTAALLASDHRGHLNVGAASANVSGTAPSDRFTIRSASSDPSCWGPSGATDGVAPQQKTSAALYPDGTRPSDPGLHARFDFSRYGQPSRWRWRSWPWGWPPWRVGRPGPLSLRRVGALLPKRLARD